MQLAGKTRRPPREIAEEIVRAAAAVDGVSQATVAGPGFVNFELADTWFTQALASVLAAGDQFGGGSAEAPERVQVEMVSANPTGPMTVAAARNGAYGDCVARLLAFAGHTVEREYYYNDAGGQMDRFRASVDAVRRGEEPPEDGYHGDYIAELAKIDGDPVPVMLGLIEAALERFRISFDTFERQSVVEAEMPEAIALLDTYEEDGALWARTSAHGDEKDRVLRRSDGTPTYFAADAAYVRRKYAKGFDHLVLRPRGRPPRLRRPPAGTGRDARPSARVARGADLPARPSHEGRRGDEDVQAPRRRGVPGRLHRRDRHRRGPLVPRLARPRPDDRHRHRPRGREVREEPGLSTSSTRTPASPGSSATRRRSRQ